MSMFMSGPAVGIGDGSLLVGWPCRERTGDQGRPFNWTPVSVAWAGSTFLVAVMKPHGGIEVVQADDLQFDVDWRRE